MKLSTIISIASLFLLTCCNGGLKESSDLDKLNLKGDVVKLEILSETTIPMSEWLYTTFDLNEFSRTFRTDAIYSFIGNSCLNFDENGNVRSQIVYDNNGEVLFVNNSINAPNLTLYNPINININELFDGWSFSYDNMGRIDTQDTSHDGKLFFHRLISYNENGDINMVVNQHKSQALHYGDTVIIPSDTTFFHYTKYDSKGNWTSGEIYQSAYASSKNFKFQVRRRITYRGDQSKQNNKFFKTSNNWEPNNNLPTNLLNMTRKSCFSNAISLDLPSCMKLDIANPNPNGLSYKLEGIEGFFSVFIAQESSQQSIFNHYSLMNFDEGYTYMMMRNLGIAVLKCTDYSIYKEINEQPCVTIKYYFYPTAGYLETGYPIFTEIYQFQSPNGGDVYSVSIGYDSYHKCQYERIAEKIKNSIIFNLK